ncbi:MAG: hypothetical protein UT44_C0008G0004 [Candidatus Levybacteria bacterium GW2011_GWA1_39_32]|nr:MAG: hypothetical protein UT44_C0008G0004 [Candidatus Levybacteria bacterium GW2011_GWA1_39_32]KKT96851.1 MAG: hypothetical protein UW97_C0001G0004 [Parcubacteria group bacterium GW2011_GWA2_45_15]
MIEVSGSGYWVIGVSKINKKASHGALSYLSRYSGHFGTYFSWRDIGLSAHRVNLCYYRIAIKRYRKYILFLAILLLVLSGVAVMSKVRYGTPRYLFSFILNPSRQNLPNKQTAAVLILTPQTEKVYVGETLSATLILDTPDKPVNMVEARIIFPTDKMEVISLSKVDSIINLWVEEPVYSNATGTITFSGGLPTPGFRGRTGKLLTITFKVKDAGEALINIENAAVLANDGLGTDVLVETQPAKLLLIKPLAGKEFGDIDGDGRIDLIDASILITNWGTPQNTRADLNNDGKVNSKDISILFANWTRK